MIEKSVDDSEFGGILLFSPPNLHHSPDSRNTPAFTSTQLLGERKERVVGTGDFHPQDLRAGKM